MMQRGFSLISIIIAVILILVLGGIAYQVISKQNQKVQKLVEENLIPSSPLPQPTPTTNETVYTEATQSANWKTYTNEIYGYSLKYPEEYTDKPSAGKYSSGKLIDSFSIKDIHELYIYIVEKPLKNYQYDNNSAGVGFRFNTDTKEWISTFTGSDPSGELKKLAPKKANSNIEAYIAAEGEVLCRWDTIIIPHPKDLVIEIIIITCAEMDSSEYKPTVPILTPDQLLATFKFLK